MFYNHVAKPQDSKRELPMSKNKSDFYEKCTGIVVRQIPYAEK